MNLAQRCRSGALYVQYGVCWDDDIGLAFTHRCGSVKTPPGLPVGAEEVRGRRRGCCICTKSLGSE